ncbi:MAG TPA: PAS domain S-box protein [Pyrinomonadaceae bacterium]|jgi:PAS domain S-box-containing protein
MSKSHDESERASSAIDSITGRSESEERFRSYFQLGLIGMAITSPSKGILEVNDEICNILGYERDELLQKTWAELTHPQDLAIDIAQFNRVMSGETEGYSLDKRWIRKDGQVIDGTISVKAVRHADGSVNYFVALLQDITERKRMEEAMRERERFVRHITELSPVMLDVFDVVTGHHPYFSSDVVDLLGYTADEIGQMEDEFSVMIHPEDIPRLRKNIERLKRLADSEINEFECRVRRGDEWRWMAARSMVFARDEQGKVQQVINATLDITARKQAEEELRKQNEVLQTIIDNIPVMIRFLGPDARVQLVNRTWEQTLGWSLGEAQLRNFDLFNDLYPDPQERQRALDFVAAATGQWSDFRIRVRDGRMIDATLANIRLSDGTNISIGQDITERKQAEEALRRAYEEVEQRVVERTRQLSAINAELIKEITERERAEVLLREAYERVEMILDSITDKFFAVDRTWRYTYLNKHAEKQLRILGKNPAGLIGRVLWDEFPNPTSGDELRHAMHERVGIIHEHYFQPLEEWIENRIYPSPDGGLAIFQRYVTERKRAEADLRRSEAYLAEGQRLSHIGSWGWNIATGESFWSQEQFRIFGFDPEGSPPSMAEAVNLIHPDDRSFIEQVLARAVREMTDSEWDCRIVSRDGTIKHVHTTAHPVFNDSGDLIEYLGTTMDTTERVRAEEERTQLLRRVINAQEEERRRIAREMHDQFGQQLSALNLKIAALKRKYGEQEELGEQLHDLGTIAKVLDRDIDYLVWEMRPSVLDDIGLEAALSNYVKRWSKRFGIEAEMLSHGMERDRLNGEIESMLYRITQEALTNIAKHAGAANVSVLLERRNNDHVSLIIEDDGRGFDAEQAFIQHEGLGLVGMRERAILVGGTLQIDSEAGRGTTIVIRIPVPYVHAGEEQHG